MGTTVSGAVHSALQHGIPFVVRSWTMRIRLVMHAQSAKHGERKRIGYARAAIIKPKSTFATANLGIRAAGGGRDVSGGSGARRDGGCGDRKIVRRGEGGRGVPPPPPIPPNAAADASSAAASPAGAAAGAALVHSARHPSGDVIWNHGPFNEKFVRTGMCTVFANFSVDLTTSTSMVIHRALQQVSGTPRRHTTPRPSARSLLSRCAHVWRTFPAAGSVTTPAPSPLCCSCGGPISGVRCARTPVTNLAKGRA